MEDVRIIRYTPEYYEDLCLYIKKTWPEKRDDYIDYCLKEAAEDEKNNLLCLNEKGEIVGCQLCFSTKALIRGVEQCTGWAHDTILDKEYRGDGGLLLMLEAQALPLFGVGLSDINQKIQKVLNATFFKDVITYFRLNLFFIRSVFLYIVRKKVGSIHFHSLDKVQIGRNTFAEVRDVASLKIPNKGYWWKGQADIDFIRDYDYLSKRFMNNFNKYYLYHLIVQGENDSCYFVIRPILYKKIPTLSIVDFRYDFEKPEQFSLISEAANRIAKANKIGLVLYLCNIGHKKALMEFSKFSILSFFPFLLRKNPGVSYVASSSFHLSQAATSLATGADADGDFRRECPTFL